jgi:hypothetical protein
MKKITWSAKRVEVGSIKPTPHNYKIKTELGMERLRTSLRSFGLAGTVILNTDLTLIDGNSRWEEAKRNKEKFLWASVPDRKLTPAEFTEMTAMYDFAKAGEVDLDRIKGDLGTSADFYKKYNLEMPLEMLEKLGQGGRGVPLSTGASIEELEQRVATSDIRMVQLFFTAANESLFRRMETELMERFGTDNVTDTVFEAFKSLVPKTKPTTTNGKAKSKNRKG